MTTYSQSSPSSDIIPVMETASLTTQSNSDVSVLPITVHKLSGQNYVQWIQSVLIYVQGKRKEDYVTRVTVWPLKEDLKFKARNAKNNKVMPWLINSRQLTLARVSCSKRPEKLGCSQGNFFRQGKHFIIV